jgi:hypothetical protein
LGLNADFFPICDFNHVVETNRQEALRRENCHPDTFVSQLQLESQEVAEREVDNPVSNKVKLDNTALNA